jgi:hypothetical protein
MQMRLADGSRTAGKRRPFDTHRTMTSKLASTVNSGADHDACAGCSCGRNMFHLIGKPNDLKQLQLEAMTA